MPFRIVRTSLTNVVTLRKLRSLMGRKPRNILKTYVYRFRIKSLLAKQVCPNNTAMVSRLKRKPPHFRFGFGLHRKAAFSAVQVVLEGDFSTSWAKNLSSLVKAVVAGKAF